MHRVQNFYNQMLLIVKLLTHAVCIWWVLASGRHANACQVTERERDEVLPTLS